jgi:sterol desaturase/sphingolipid hydroxylase (fatty acid hydroxylase superfamily)
MPTLGQLINAQLTTIIAFGAIILFAVMEVAFPRMRQRPAWREHLPPILAFAAMTVGTTLVLQFAAQAPLLAAIAPLQVFHLARLDWPEWAVFAVSFLVVDFLTYVLHRLNHLVPMLWRLHAIHHSDENVTAVTGQLHHPLETAVSFVFLLSLYVLLGVPVKVAIIYGLTYAVHNAFTHADIALPDWLDRPMRWIVVTPDLHRTHHSVEMGEGNSNFGQIFTIWDRLLGTYVDRPSLPAAELRMGLPLAARPPSFRTGPLLLYPFARKRPDGGPGPGPA